MKSLFFHVPDKYSYLNRYIYLTINSIEGEQRWESEFNKGENSKKYNYYFLWNTKTTCGGYYELNPHPAYRELSFMEYLNQISP